MRFMSRYDGRWVLVSLESQVEDTIWRRELTDWLIDGGQSLSWQLEARVEKVSNEMFEEAPPIHQFRIWIQGDWTGDNDNYNDNGSLELCLQVCSYNSFIALVLVKSQRKETSVSWTWIVHHGARAMNTNPQLYLALVVSRAGTPVTRYCVTCI